MKRFDTISTQGECKIINYKLPEYSKGKYIVDKSHFTPVSELAKSVVGQSIGKSDLVRYDFVDGTDNGMEVPVARRRAELAEVSVDVRNQQEKVKEKIETAQKVAEFQALTRKAANETNKE